MTQIPDASVQAFRQSFESTDNNCETYQDVRKALAAALPHLPLGYEVKQLEWEFLSGDYYAQGCGTQYNVYSSRPNRWNAVTTSPKNIRLVTNGTLEEAKSAAQADFERRVRECIVAKTVDVDAIKADHEKEMTEVIKERDQAEAWADKLARAIGGEGIGEHSNINNPWANALEIAENCKPVDVAAVRRQAFEEAAKVAEKYDGMPCGAATGWPKDEIQHYMTGQQDASSSIAYGIRALSAEPAQGEQWQPIETAPKDGTKILVWSSAYNGRWTIAHWDDNKYAKKPVPRWVSNEGAYERRTLITFPPTHWIPLPAAPTSEAET